MSEPDPVKDSPREPVNEARMASLAPPATTWSQRAWSRFCRFMVSAFYGKFEVTGQENIPRDGPVLLCANHVNALVDAVVVQAAASRAIHPLARSGLFRNPFLRTLLHLIQAVPIYRRPRTEAVPATAAERSQNNERTFERCFEYLSENRLILIFPEGQSHSDPHLRDLKTGAARLALGSLKRDGLLPTLIPVGLTFTHKGRFRANALVQIGSPIVFQAEAEDVTEENNEATVRRLTDAIAEGLAGVTLNMDSWEDLALLKLLQSFFTLSRDRRARRGRPSLSDRFRSMQKLSENHRLLRFTHPEKVAQLRQKLQRFERLCRRYGVQDYQLNLRYRPTLVARFAARSISFTLLILPLALWGFLNSILPFQATRLAAKWSARGRDQYDTAGMVFGLLFFTLFWGAQVFAVFSYFGLQTAALYGLSLPITWGIATAIGRERQRILENVRVFFLFLRKKDLQGYLRLKREELEVDLARMAKLVRPQK